MRENVNHRSVMRKGKNPTESLLLIISKGASR